MAHAYTGWGTSRAIAIGVVGIAMVLVGLAGRAARRHGSRFGGLVNGMDNRWSTSKVAVLLWTAAILWAFVTLLIRYCGSAVPNSVPAAYVALLGIPSAGALGAKAITGSQALTGGKTSLESGTLNPLKGIGQIFSDDTGATDLLDSQYFLFNLVLLGYFVASFWHIGSPNGSDIPLPALPGSLLALAGVSTATYLGKKGLSGSAGVTSLITAGSSLQLTADSDVSLPDGGTITLKSPGAIAVFPGVTYSCKTGGAVESATGGQLTTTTVSQLKLTRGATISGPPGSIIRVLEDATALVSDGSTAVDAQGAPAPNAATGGKDLSAGGTITLGPNGKVILVSDGAVFGLVEGAVIEYAAAGIATVDQGALRAIVSAGAALGQAGIGIATFPRGAVYVDASNPGPAQRLEPGGGVELVAGTPASPERSVILVEPAEGQLPARTQITFPAAPMPVGAGVKTTATSSTTVNLTSGGDVELGPASGVAAHVPNGSVVTAASGTDAATVTATG